MPKNREKNEVHDSDAIASETAAIVLAAGRSKRMLSAIPKVLHPVLGLPLVVHVLDALADAGVGRVVLVANPENEGALRDAIVERAREGRPLPRIDVAVQTEAKGTAHAVLSAREALKDFAGTILVLCGDAPCVSPTSLQALLAEHRARAADVSVLSGEVANATGYGRIVRGPDGDLSSIVEEKDATPHVRAIREINSGIWALEAPRAFELIEKIQPSKVSGELYLTEIVTAARTDHRRAVAVRAAEPEDVLGVNDREDLALVTAVLKRRVCAKHMKNGVTIVDPETTFIDSRATIGRDATIFPFVVIDGACAVGEGARIGPFAHIRGGSRVGESARIGNFVEVVRSDVAARAKALHLAYLGDTKVGANANVGAGTITANYDGHEKHETRIGSGAHLGSGTVLIAPCEVGSGARTGAGAIVTARSKIPAGETWVGVPARAMARAAKPAAPATKPAAKAARPARPARKRKTGRRA